MTTARPPDAKRDCAPGGGSSEARGLTTTVGNAKNSMSADAEPEHRGDRRRFLVWAVLCGFAKPERLTERIVAELEEEAVAL